jgi:broad specificity phosphatase PhoE
MKNQKIILLRHGESIGNVWRDAFIKYSDEFHTLTPLGLSQASLASSSLSRVFTDNPVKVYCSPFTRTIQTLDQIKKSKMLNIKKTILDSNLMEQNWGKFEDMEEYHVAFRGYKGDRRDYAFHRGGESGLNAYKRAENFIETLLNDKSKCILVVSHGVLIRFIVSIIKDVPYEEINTLRIIDNCEFITVERNGDYLEIKADMVWKGKAD